MCPPPCHSNSTTTSAAPFPPLLLFRAAGAGMLGCIQIDPTVDSNRSRASLCSVNVVSI